MVHPRAKIIGLAAAAMLLFLATPAAAHTELTATGPADGATITVPIDEVTLTFAEAVRGDGITITVTGPGGTTYNKGAASVLNTTVHQPVAALRSGAYQVAWHVLAADGDPVEGQFGFTVALPPELEPGASPTASPEPSAQPTPTSPATGSKGVESGVFPVGWVAGAVILVILVVVAVVRSGRRGQ